MWTNISPNYFILDINYIIFDIKLPREISQEDTLKVQDNMNDNTKETPAETLQSKKEADRLSPLVLLLKGKKWKHVILFHV